MICGLCYGAGNRFCMQDGHREWWGCQACGGAGVRAQVGPALILVRSKGFSIHPEMELPAEGYLKTGVADAHPVG